MTKQFCIFPPWLSRCVSSTHSKSVLHIRDVIYFPISLEQHLQHNLSVLEDLYLAPLQPPQGRIYMHIKFWNGSFHEEIISDCWLGFCHLFPVRKLKQRSKSSGDGSVKCFQICFRISFGQAVMQNVLFPADGVSTRFSRGIRGMLRTTVKV